MSLDVSLEVDGVEIFEWNITHNLTTMAREAGVYEACWRPDEIGITKARQLVPLLSEGLRLLVADPSKFESFNPKNGWGDYEGLVNFVMKYCVACARNPEADVRVSR